MYYFTNTHAVIDTNDNWAKQAETQFHYAHGRGQVGFTKTEEVVRIDEKDTAVTVMRFETAPGAEYLITPVQ